MPDALPAVTEPSFLNAGFIFASVSIVVFGLDMLVGVEDDFALPRLLDDGHDLRLEAPFGDGGRRAAMRLDRQRVLLLAGDAPLGDQVLGRDPMWPTPKGSVTCDHHVDQLGIAHARAGTHGGDR